MSKNPKDHKNLLAEVLPQPILQAQDLVGIFESVDVIAAIIEGKQPIKPHQAQQLADRFHLPATIFLQ
jgi:antitoxin component HigA of HigAB toxin-antitoxin module